MHLLSTSKLKVGYTFTATLFNSYKWDIKLHFSLKNCDKIKTEAFLKLYLIPRRGCFVFVFFFNSPTQLKSEVKGKSNLGSNVELVLLQSIIKAELSNQNS